MHLFYTPSLLPTSSMVSLSEEESKHCVKVLRMRIGNELLLLDGKGGRYHATIIKDNPQKVDIQIITYTKDVKKFASLHIGIAPPKNIERLEWFLEKATEVGIVEITPLYCEHSERKDLRIDRLQKVIISAMKQSRNSYLPKLNELTKYKEFVEKAKAQHKMMAHCAIGEKQYIHQILTPNADALILIGPEGDFSSKEITFAIEHQFNPISLGNSRLRTETAALQSCIEFNIFNR